MTSVLLHTCCGPCASYVAKSLREQGEEVTAFWYNPNVHPFREHQRRLEAMQTLSRVTDLPLVIDEGYDMLEYFRAVVGHESDRCPDCYRLRLSRTAEVAYRKGFDAFTTTLLISLYQNHELLHEIGEALGDEFGVEFHYEDFRPGFRESHSMSKELGLYHQGYCGCVYSEWERYGKVKI
ncbi:MAG: epoxyqueuosine reductase QueH [Dehalococcoidia bacterium]|nr:MAG: epoxyqueuosine reductase QueH [Dehalococcoidia bacterium]